MQNGRQRTSQNSRSTLANYFIWKPSSGWPCRQTRYTVAIRHVLNLDLWPLTRDLSLYRVRWQQRRTCDCSSAALLCGRPPSRRRQELITTAGNGQRPFNRRTVRQRLAYRTLEQSRPPSGTEQPRRTRMPSTASMQEFSLVSLSSFLPFVQQSATPCSVLRPFINENTSETIDRQMSKYGVVRHE